MDTYAEQEYKELLAQVVSFAEDLWKIEGYPYLEDISIPESLKEKDNSRKEYIEFIFEELNQIGYKTPMLKNEILPCWYAYPSVPMASTAWRMGAGETYSDLFWSYYDSLSKEERQAYDTKYPTPLFWNIDYIADHWDELERECQERKRLLIKDANNIAKMTPIHKTIG